jgi:hypothetical protein
MKCNWVEIDKNKFRCLSCGSLKGRELGTGKTCYFYTSYIYSVERSYWHAEPPNCKELSIRSFLE